MCAGVGVFSLIEVVVLENVRSAGDSLTSVTLMLIVAIEKSPAPMLPPSQTRAWTL